MRYVDCYTKLEWPAEPVTLDEVVENNIWAVFKQFQESKSFTSILLWRYPVEKTRRVSNGWADKDSKTRDQKVDRIYTCCKVKVTET